MTDTTSLRRVFIAPLVLTLSACSAGSSIVGLPDAGNDLGRSDVITQSDSPTGDGPTSDTSPAPRAAWTIFVYGHADHNLSPSLENDINKMTQAALGTSVNVVVMADFDSRKTVAGATMPGSLFSPADATARRTYPAGTAWYRIRPMAAPEVIRTEPEQDLDDPMVLTRAVNYAFERYPAERYGIVMWDHGGSWDGGFGGDTQDGTRMPTSMRPVDAARSIQTALTMRGLIGPRRLDFLTFDTCLMATAEVIGEFEGLTKVYIANAELDYGAGWNYAATFGYIAANPTATAQDIARQEVMHWDQLHATATFLDRVARSHVAIDTARVAAFNTAVGELTRLVITATDPMVTARFARHGYRALPVYLITLDSSEEPARKYRDLGQLFNSVAMDTMLPMPIRTAATTARTRLTEMILGSNQGVIRAATMQLGVHVGFPLPTMFTDPMAMLYRTNTPSWAMASDWGTMLLSMRPSPLAPGPEISATSSANTTNPSATARPSVTLTASGDVVEAVGVVLEAVSPTEFKVFEEFARTEIVEGTASTLTWDGQLTDLVGVGAAASDAGLVHAEVTVSTVLPSSAITPSMTAPSAVGIRGVCASGGTNYGCVLLCGDMGMRALSPMAVIIEITPGQASVQPFEEIIAQDPNITFAPVLRGIRVMASADAGAAPTVTENSTLGPAIRMSGPAFQVSSIQAPAGTYHLFGDITDVYGRSTSGFSPAITITTPFGP